MFGMIYIEFIGILLCYSDFGNVSEVQQQLDFKEQKLNYLIKDQKDFSF